jgi:16S rRNA (guanine527-N7)-methyltransferase
VPDPVAALDARTAERLRRFAALVRASDHNLVSQRARSELETRHIPECVAFARLLPSGSVRVLDLGSGGGFPGMVLAIVRAELDVHLLDATAKKTAFLAGTASELDVAVHVHTGRAEDLRRNSALAGGFDAVTARAVAPLQRLVAWSMPFLRPGGALYAIKGERWAEELAASRDAIERAGASLLATPDDVPDARPPASGVPPPRVVMLARVS